MKACYFSKKTKYIRFLLLIVGLLLFYGLTIYGVFIILFYSSEGSIIIPCGIIMITVGTLSAIESSLQYRLLNRKYMVESIGIYVQHTRRNTQFYPWAQILEICLCDIHQGSREQVKDTVIWCTVGSIKNGPPDIKRRWNSPYYGIRNYYSVITIEFSEERLSEIKQFYSGAITDYR